MRWRGDRDNGKGRRKGTALRRGVRAATIVHHFTKGMSVSRDGETGEGGGGLGEDNAGGGGSKGWSLLQAIVATARLSTNLSAGASWSDSS